MNNGSGEIVQDADFAADLTDSNLTLDGMLCKFGGHTTCADFVGVREADGRVTQQHRS